MSEAMQAKRKMWSMPHHARIRLFQYPLYELAVGAGTSGMRLLRGSMP